MSIPIPGDHDIIEATGWTKEPKTYEGTFDCHGVSFTLAEPVVVPPGHEIHLMRVKHPDGEVETFHEVRVSTALE